MPGMTICDLLSSHVKIGNLCREWFSTMTRNGSEQCSHVLLNGTLQCPSKGTQKVTFQHFPTSTFCPTHAESVLFLLHPWGARAGAAGDVVKTQEEEEYEVEWAPEDLSRYYQSLCFTADAYRTWRWDMGRDMGSLCSFIPRLPMKGEETEYCLRPTQSGESGGMSLKFCPIHSPIIDCLTQIFERLQADDASDKELTEAIDRRLVFPVSYNPAPTSQSSCSYPLSDNQRCERTVNLVQRLVPSPLGQLGVWRCPDHSGVELLGSSHYIAVDEGGQQREARRGTLKVDFILPVDSDDSSSEGEEEGVADSSEDSESEDEKSSPLCASDDEGSSSGETDYRTSGDEDADKVS